MKSAQHIDHLLSKWSFDPMSLSVRMVKGKDERDVIQMRVDMGILQMETVGRPDGSHPHGCDSFLEYLTQRESEEGEFELTEAECHEVEREFMQMYHRRICWLRLQYYRNAVTDADHTLALMDLSARISPEEEWASSHEQYRPFVLFHRTQAASLAELEEKGAEEAVQAINAGLDSIRDVFASHEVEDHFESDELVVRLVELRESMRREYDIGQTLHEQLADAVKNEKYELAAELRDELARRGEVGHH